MMPYFKELVDAFYEIEKNGHCIVDGVIYPVHISVKVVADMSFLHKYLGRGVVTLAGITRYYVIPV